MAKNRKKTKTTNINSSSFLGSNVVKGVIVLLFIAFAIYSIVTVLNLNSQISSKKAEYKEINDKIKVQQIKNEEMEKMVNYKGDALSKYIERVARDELDYVKNGERVFVNVSGD